jgi:hypothetical protein
MRYAPGQVPKNPLPAAPARPRVKPTVTGAPATNLPGGPKPTPNLGTRPPGKGTTGGPLVKPTPAFKKGGAVKKKMAKGGAATDKKIAKVGKVMKEFKEGTLHSGKNGKVVKDKGQAIAIALAQARKKK